MTGIGDRAQVTWVRDCPHAARGVYDARVRSHGFTGFGVLALALAGCGPGQPSGYEGFGERGETLGDGDGDGDVDPDPSGDGDPSGGCIDVSFLDTDFVFVNGELGPPLVNKVSDGCAATPGPDYVVHWRAATGGVYRAEMLSEFPAWLEMRFDGCQGPIGQCLATENSFASFEFYADPGQEFVFILDTEFEFGGYFEFGLYPSESPGSCPDDWLFDTPAIVQGTTVGGGNDFSSFCGGDAAPDRSYFYAPPVSGLYRIYTIDSDFDPILHVYAGACFGPLLDCNDDANDLTLESGLLLNLAADELYTIVVDGFGGSAGNFTLVVEPDQPPSSLCEDIQLLDGPLPIVTTWPAAASSANVFHQCSFASFERRFMWLPPGPGTYRVTQTTQAPLFSALSVVHGGCFGGDQTTFCGISDLNNQVQLEFQVTSNAEVIFVSEWDPDGPGDLELLLEAVDGDPGGPGCGEHLGEGAPIFASGTTVGAGNDYAGSCSRGPAPEREYWWTAPATGTYLISLEGSTYDTLLYVRNGGCNGPELGCNDDTDTPFGIQLWSSLELDLNAGQTISIFVDGYSSAGNYQLAITQL
jgi:hypothetical protein